MSDTCVLVYRYVHSAKVVTLYCSWIRLVSQLKLLDLDNRTLSQSNNVLLNCARTLPLPLMPILWIKSMKENQGILNSAVLVARVKSVPVLYMLISCKRTRGAYVEGCTLYYKANFLLAIGNKNLDLLEFLLKFVMSHLRTNIEKNSFAFKLNIYRGWSSRWDHSNHLPSFFVCPAFSHACCL